MVASTPRRPVSILARSLVAAGGLALLGAIVSATPAAAQWDRGDRWERGQRWEHRHQRRWAPPPRRCWVERRRVWTQWGWRVSRERVCARY